MNNNKKSFCIFLKDNEDIIKKLKTKAKIISLAVLMGLSLSACQSTSSVEYNFKETNQIEQVVEKKNIENAFDIKEQVSFIKERKNGFYDTGFGEVGFYFDNKDSASFLEEIKEKYDIDDLTTIEYAISPRSEQKQPEIHFMRIPYGKEGKFLKIIKFDTGNAEGNEIDLKNFEDYNRFKGSWSNFDIAHDNFEEFVLMHELFHAPEYIWEKSTNLREFFADMGSVLSISLEKDFTYKKMRDFANEIRIKRGRDLSIYRLGSHYNEDLFTYDTFKNILPTENEFKEMARVYKSKKINDGSELNLISDFLITKINNVDKIVKNNQQIIK